MSVARHHAEWLSLVEATGPFISMPVLLRVFPQGLEPRDAEQAALLRESYDAWLDTGQKNPSDHLGWVRQVLNGLLGYPKELLVEGQAIPPGLESPQPQYSETLRPDLVLKHSDPNGKTQLLISIYPPSQDLEKPVTGKIWKAAPGTRMMELCHSSDVPLGLITNGEQWILVFAPRGETTGFASWYSDIWMQETITLRAFTSLLHLRRFLGVAPDETLQALYVESSKDQQEVTEQLGYQVRKAVEVLVQAFDRKDAESNRKLLKNVNERDLYDSALTVMMRLVFLFSAEERDLLPLEDQFYNQNYAVSTLGEYLRVRADQHGEEILERRNEAWCRLLATFRAVHGGVGHEAMRLPAYGGTLFDPDRYPFLEGRLAGTKWLTMPAQPFPVNDRVVLHLLEALQLLRVKVPGGGPAEARRISFRALDIEQIGHVYEGLLDHTAKRATDLVLGLTGTRDSETEISISKLVEMKSKGLDVYSEFLEEETGRSANAIKKTIELNEVLDDQTLLLACANDSNLSNKVKPFSNLIREDSFGRLMVINDGSLYVTRGTDRRSTGTHYTPKSLTEPIVRYTLEPLVYFGPAEGKDQSEWRLRPPKEILSLKVCDLAMGSGAFLGQVCRYLSERLVEAWEIEEKANPGKILSTPEGDFSEGKPEERLIPIDPSERLAIARRYIADRCLYGIDINPMAVEMAKLSLWLITLQKDRPFNFLNHAFKSGNSLFGITDLKQLENFSMRPDIVQITFSTMNLSVFVEDAANKRKTLEMLPSVSHEQLVEKEKLNVEANQKINKIKFIADILLGLELLKLKSDAYERARHKEAASISKLLEKNELDSLLSLETLAKEKLPNIRTFHWALEFPEVKAQGGFDAFVGNPPFLGGRRISFRLGDNYYKNLQTLYPWATGTTDLCVYFLNRAADNLKGDGALGMILSDIVTQGDSRNSGLERLTQKGFQIIGGKSSRHWPGSAGVKIVDCHLFNGLWNGKLRFDDEKVDLINTRFQNQVQRADPFPLKENEGLSFSGHYLMGQGFLMEPEEAKKLVNKNPKNSAVIFDYIKGDELNNDYTQTATLKAINFGFRDLRTIQDEFPDALKIVREKVKPERDKVKRKANRERWWRYAEARPGLEEAVKNTEKVILQPYTAKYVIPTFFPSRSVFAHPLVVIVDSSMYRFACLQSTVHSIWVWENCATNLDLLAYTANRVLETFPFPERKNDLEKIGTRYYEHRDKLRLNNKLSLNEIYNLFHDPNCKMDEIIELKKLHIEIDKVLVAAYGWSGLKLNHNYYETKQGIRFTFEDNVRREILNRLLSLNHQRYETEIKSSKGAEKTKTDSKVKYINLEPEILKAAESSPQTDMFNES